ncbi:MAG: response regulator [Desulfurivibrio sp.]|nr:response regulator [Desulfurivibrio sp.]
MKILIADDDPVTRTILTHSLGKWGYKPVAATDGKAAWEIMRQADAPRLALIDWVMPGLDGLELCRKIRRMTGSSPPYLIMLTAKEKSSDLVAGLEAGANDYVIKPFDSEVLHAKIRAGIRLLEQQQGNLVPIFKRKADATLPAIPVVLLIEDQPDEATLIRHQLLARDHHAFIVHPVQSLAAARKLLAEKEINPDVILLDLNLPDSAGAQTVARCRVLSDAPIVVLTGQDDKADRQLAIESGAEDFLSKGGEATSLRRAVRYAMLRHRRDADIRLAAAVVEHAREGIIIARTDGTIIEVNEAFCRITGYQRQEVIGQTPRLLQSGHHGPEFYDEMWRALQSEGFWSGEIWNRHKDGRVYPEMLTISAVPDSTGATTHYVALFSDISELKAQQQQLELIAHYDTLTGLPNRSLLADRLQQAMSQTTRRGTLLAIVYLDLDGFKEVNDSHGHDVGDRLLCALAGRMKETLRESDTLARLGVTSLSPSCRICRIRMPAGPFCAACSKPPPGRWKITVSTCRFPPVWG